MITGKQVLATLLLTGLITAANVRQLKAQDHSSTTVQTVTEVAVNPKDPAFRAKYKDLSFGDHFVLNVFSDDRNNYYAVDFSKLPSRFEKVFFMNLVFNKDKVVNIDSDISQQQVWFLGSKMFSEASITDILDTLKAETLKANTSFTAAEKDKWLKENDKYGKEGAK
jgi:hypothetical protein